MKCDWEQRVIAASRSGSWNASLRAHLQACAVCRQTELIAESLQELAAKTLGAVDLPPAGLVWRRAQALGRERALLRATRRPFLIVGTFGAVYCVVFLLWSILQLPQSVHRLFVLSPGLTQELAIAGAALSAALAIVGSCVLTLESKR